MLEGLVVRAPRSGRRTCGEAAKQAVVQLCLRPGVSVAGAAPVHGIKANLCVLFYSFNPGVCYVGCSAVTLATDFVSSPEMRSSKQAAGLTPSALKASNDAQ